MSNDKLTVAEQIAAAKYARELLSSTMKTARGPVLDVCRTLIQIVDAATESDDMNDFVMDLVYLSERSRG